MDPHNLSPGVAQAASTSTSAEAGAGAGTVEARAARRPPTSLFDRAALVLAERILAHVTDVAADKNKARPAAARSLLAGLPSRIVDSLTCTVVSRYVDLRGEDSDGDNGGRHSLVLLDVLAAPVTAVDMSPLVWLGRSSPADQTAFSARLVHTLPRLRQLTRLSLGTHGQRFTLPVCSDDVLHAVAEHCPALRHLDVSHNTAVSAFGLTSLCAGCPLLEELLVNDCVLPAGVLAGVLQALPHLRVLGHQEVGAAVLLLFHQGWGLVQDEQEVAQDIDPLEGPVMLVQDSQGAAPHAPQERRKLRLTQVTNLGETAMHRSKSGDEATRLRCRPALVRALRVLCPDLEELRVRVLDGDVRHLASLRGLQSLELRFHATAHPTSVGPHTLQYLRLHGARLTELTVYSHKLTALDFDTVGRHCPQLRQLWMRCNFLSLDVPGRPEDAPPCRRLTRLENLSIRVGWDERSQCHFPAAFVRGLVRDVRALRKLYLAVNSRDVTDEWLRLVLDSMDCAALRTLFVLLPARNAAHAGVPGGLLSEPRLGLTPDSVRLVRARCPDLEELGNLLVWCFHQEEIRYMQEQLRATNCALKLVSKETIWR